MHSSRASSHEKEQGMTKLEICCYGIDCAMTAQASGADRVECAVLRVKAD